MDNPVELWSTGRLLATALLFVVALVVAGGLIYVSDKPIRDAGLGDSARLEWPLRPSESESISGCYVAHGVRGDVLRGVVLDTVLFIPAYAGLVGISCLWAARGLGGAGASLGLVLAWGALVAGGLDAIENAGIVAQLALGWSFAAPLTGLVCRLKWALAGAGAVYALVGLVVGVTARLVAVGSGLLGMR